MCSEPKNLGRLNQTFVRISIKTKPSKENLKAKKKKEGFFLRDGLKRFLKSMWPFPRHFRTLKLKFNKKDTKVHPG